MFLAEVTLVLEVVVVVVDVDGVELPEGRTRVRATGDGENLLTGSLDFDLELTLDPRLDRLFALASSSFSKNKFQSISTSHRTLSSNVLISMAF